MLHFSVFLLWASWSNSASHSWLEKHILCTATSTHFRFLFPEFDVMLGETQILVSGPSAMSGWKEFLILATSAAQRCPKPLLYHSGEWPFRSILQMWVSLDLPEPHGSIKYWESITTARTPPMSWASSCSWGGWYKFCFSPQCRLQWSPDISLKLHRVDPKATHYLALNLAMTPRLLPCVKED